MNRTSILVVEDDQLLRSVIAELLEQAGYRVCSVADGGSAVTAAEASLPSAMLLDLQLPVLDGRGVAHELAARGVNVPIIAMSASSVLGRTAEEIGARAKLQKPFSAAQLIDTVKNVCCYAGEEAFSEKAPGLPVTRVRCEIAPSLSPRRGGGDNTPSPLAGEGGGGG